MLFTWKILTIQYPKTYYIDLYCASFAFDLAGVLEVRIIREGDEILLMEKELIRLSLRDFLLRYPTIVTAPNERIHTTAELHYPKRDLTRIYKEEEILFPSYRILASYLTSSYEIERKLAQVFIKEIEQLNDSVLY